MKRILFGITMILRLPCPYQHRKDPETKRKFESPVYQRAFLELLFQHADKEFTLPKPDSIVGQYSAFFLNYTFTTTSGPGAPTERPGTSVARAGVEVNGFKAWFDIHCVPCEGHFVRTFHLYKLWTSEDRKIGYDDFLLFFKATVFKDAYVNGSTTVEFLRRRFVAVRAR